MENHQITDNVALSRYELVDAGHVVYADYSIEGDILNIRYVFAPESLRGTGVAGRLMEGVADAARAQNLKIRPICGYAAAWLRKHKEYKDLIV